MKSIQNQYRDLKEGKMSQANFMRNLRMTMPHLVTNVTSFDDSIKILKNKGILSEIALYKKPEEKSIVKSGGSVKLDGMFRDLYGKPFLSGYFLDYNFDNPHQLVIQISKEPAQAGQKKVGRAHV